MIFGFNTITVLLISILIVLLAIVCLLCFRFFLNKKPEEGQPNKYQANAQSAIRDVMIASLSKGQLPVAILGIIMIILVIRIPVNEIPKLISDLFKVFTTFGGLAWALLMVVILYSIASIHKIKTNYKNEIQRKENENKALQQKNTDLINDLKTIRDSKKIGQKK